MFQKGTPLLLSAERGSPTRPPLFSRREHVVKERTLLLVLPLIPLKPWTCGPLAGFGASRLGMSLVFLLPSDDENALAALKSA
jgi:hypothetical protein